MTPLLVSACLLGLNTRYDGRSKENSQVTAWLRQERVIPVPVCPEQLAGLPTPRPACSYSHGDGIAVLDGQGMLIEETSGQAKGDVFLQGAVTTLRIARLSHCPAALLKERSPSCGTTAIYCNGQLCPGMGITSALLARNGLKLFNENQLDALSHWLSTHQQPTGNAVTAENTQRNGILFVVSAPSGAGKTSLCRQVMAESAHLHHSVSYTTRPPRLGEVAGHDYHFVDDTTFAEMVAQQAFVEWARVHGNSYGTAWRTLQEAQELGQDLLLDIDCQGALQLQRSGLDTVGIFILPPSYNELKMRLESRGQDTPEVIATRLDHAREEIAHARDYDYLIVNENFSQAAATLMAIIQAERQRSQRLWPYWQEKFHEETDA